MPTNDKNTFEHSSAPTDFDVRTMPQKFLSTRVLVGSGRHQAHSLKKNILIGAILLVVIGGALALAAWFFLKSVKKEQPPLVNSAPPSTTAPATLNTENVTPPTPTSTEAVFDQSLLDVNQWLTFTDPVYPFSFKYPATWLQSTSAPATDSEIIYGLSVAGATDGAIKIAVYDNPNQVSLATWLTTDLGLSSVDLESYRLNNLAAYRYNDVLHQSFIIYTLYEDHFYALEFLNPSLSEINDVYQQFLVNWQFTTVPTAVETTVDNQADNSPALDSDQDSLTDVEELIYGTDRLKADSDDDGYNDGSEIANLYNPLVAGSARLYDSDLVKTHVNNYYHYNLLYPATWQVKETSGSVIFQDTSGEFIQVVVESNGKNYQDIKKWYQSYLSLDPALVVDTTIGGTTSAILSPDQSRLYFIYGQNIYSLIYNTGLRQNGNFSTTFKMVRKSFQLMKID